MRIAISNPRRSHGRGAHRDSGGDRERQDDPPRLQRPDLTLLRHRPAGDHVGEREVLTLKEQGKPGLGSVCIYQGTPPRMIELLVATSAGWDHLLEAEKKGCCRAADCADVKKLIADNKAKSAKIVDDWRRYFKGKVSEIVVAGNSVLDWEPAPPNVGNTVMWFLLSKGVVFQVSCWYAGAKHGRCPVWATIAAKHVYDQLK